MRAHQVISGAPPLPGDLDGKVTRWRRQRLLLAGFAPPLAHRLAATPGVDLHALLDLVDRGCPPDLAARILDPVTEADAGP
jgi:hypothetical protein